MFTIVNVYEFEKEIKAAFQHMHYRQIPEGQPLNATIEELETDYRVIG